MMNENEKQLTLARCDPVAPCPEKIEKLISKGAATSAVLGELLFNRMGAVACKVLCDCGLIQSVNREFRNTLTNTARLNIEYNKSFAAELRSLAAIMAPFTGKYVFLKGAYLYDLFPPGCRTSNDADILAAPECVTRIGEALTASGFLQGNVRNGEFVPASRSEIINSKMMRGETVPYIKKTDHPFMRFFEVDINFSLGYKSGDSDTVRDILESSVLYKDGETVIPIPCDNDFMLQLCAHLYKEASVYPWIKMKRDMTLYKYVDIYYLLSKRDMTDAEKLIKRAVALGLQDACYYAFTSVCELFSDKKSGSLRDKIAPFSDCGAILKVISPSDKKLFYYKEANVKKRFFARNRIDLLEEAKA